MVGGEPQASNYRAILVEFIAIMKQVEQMPHESHTLYVTDNLQDQTLLAPIFNITNCWGVCIRYL